MCHETPSSIAPRIIALLRDETVAWTGNEILSRISTGDDPCELHFDQTVREMVRDRKLTSESDVFAPTLTSTTRCRLAYVLTDEAKAPTTIQPVPVPVKPKAPTVVAAPPPPPPPPVAVPPPLPSPAARLEAIGRLRDERARVEREWFGRFGDDCFRNGSAGFMKALFTQARVHGMLPRMRDALERAQDRRLDDFERHCEDLLQVNDRDGTIPGVVLDAGVKLDVMSYVSLDLDRAEKDVREGREGNPANAREILAFLRTAIDNPVLKNPPESRVQLPPPPASAPVPQTKPPMIVLHTGTTKVTKDSSDDPLIGSAFGPYKVVRAIGRGGMGAVYEGIDETLERRVALKVLHAQFADNREYQDRFLREARNAANANLDHPNITQVYSAGRQGANLWLAMQLVRGRTLAKVLEERRTMPADEALRIVRQTAEGLAVAHAAGMIHRDIKPDNLMIDEGGRVKIMDFGLMRSVDVKKDGLTQDGLFVGTLEYASPEQCQDKVLDARTDLYSLGVVLYQLLSGSRPYEARTAFGYLSMIPDPKQPPVPLRRHLADVAPAVEELVHKMIAKRPEDRFASAPELIKSIDALLGSAMRVTAVRTPPARKALVSLVVWSVVLLGAIAGAVVFWPKDPPPVDPPKMALPSVTPPTKVPEPPVIPARPVIPDPKIVPPKNIAEPPVTPKDPRLALLLEHAPNASELDLLEELLAVSRATLAARRGYAFDAAAEKILEFRRQRTLPPWVELFAQTEAERMQAATAAFQARPLFDPKEERLLELRDGRTLRGRVVSEAGGRMTVEAADGGREEVALAMIAPATFPAARGKKLETVLVRSAAGDAAGALPMLAGLDEADRRRLAPILLDQAIEEMLQGGDLKAIAAYELPAEPLLGKRLSAVAVEKEAAALSLRPDEEGSLRKLLTTHVSTRAGIRAARETLEGFDKSIPGDEKFELVSATAWGTWDVDTRDAPGGTVVFDKSKNVYILSANSAKEQVRLLKKLRGAERGYRVRWSFGAGAPDAAAFMVAISFTRWFETGPRSVALFRADKEGTEEKISTVRKVDLSERLAGGVLHVLPRASLILVYLNGRLLFALPEKEYAIGGGLQLGMSGGSVTLESLRVLDRARD